MISADKREEILELLREGKADSADIAHKTGVPIRTVAAIKAHLKMGDYSTESTGMSEEVADAIETTFGLERDLQEALLKNIEQLEKGLTVAEDGKEHIVPSGRIDILATDSQQRAVVIELKAGTADRDALGQILSYMGDLHTAVAKTPVRGVLVAADFTARAIAAAKAVPSVELRKYAFKFSFHKAG
jgi:RecB family endonuclease NucS